MCFLLLKLLYLIYLIRFVSGSQIRHTEDFLGSFGTRKSSEKDPIVYKPSVYKEKYL